MVNGKLYIGQTNRTMFDRRRAHERYSRNGVSFPLYRAMRKYGKDVFEWSVLYDNLDEDDLDVFELALISKLNTVVPNGYNLSEGGVCRKAGWHHTEESKRKVSESNKGRKAPNLGIPHSEETKRKIKEKAKERAQTVEGMAQLVRNGKLSKGRKGSKTFLGKRHTEESKKKMSEKAKEVQNRPDVRQRKSAAIIAAKAGKDYAHTEEEKNNISNKMKVLWQDPVFRARIIESRRLARLAKQVNGGALLD